MGADVRGGGLRRSGDENFSKTHDFQEWAKSAGLNREGIQRLNHYFIHSSPKVHDYFQIETFAGEVESYTDRKLLIYAVPARIKNKGGKPPAGGRPPPPPIPFRKPPGHPRLYPAAMPLLHL